LENAQIELNVESQNFVPVVYKTEMDGSTVKDLIPTLLIIGKFKTIGKQPTMLIIIVLLFEKVF
jgi:hypothetical protein